MSQKELEILLEKFANKYQKNLRLIFQPIVKNYSSNIFIKKDFSAFCKSKSDVKNKVCNVTYANCYSHNDMFIFKITANRFLHNMVRSIVGTLIDFSLSKTNEFFFFFKRVLLQVLRMLIRVSLELLIKVHYF